jgi:hypothetical protein
VSMSNHDFCRLLLKTTRDDLTSEQRKRLVGSWSYMYRWGSAASSGEWHGPDGYYWHGSACCAYEARTHGINAWLQEFYPEADNE